VTANSASCSLTYTPASAESDTITATYGGDSTHAPSDSTPLALSVGKRSTSTSVTCSPNPVSASLATACTATVNDTAPGTPTAPTGTVRFTGAGGSFSNPGSSCQLKPATRAGTAKCTVDFTATQAGTPGIQANYAADATHAASTSPTATLTVTGCPGGPRCGRTTAKTI
jgi:polyisoprenoid-binding protein YceI